MVRLPVFINSKIKYPAAVAAILYSVFIYQWANTLPFGQPHVLPILWFDQYLPFIPEFFWIYITEYILFLVAIFSFKDNFRMSQFFYAFLSHQTLAVLIFLLFPTTFSRDLWPAPDTLSGQALGWFRVNLDEPNNCFPSLHVASSYLTALALGHHFRKFGPWIMWGSLIAASTLFTKQHSVLDVLAGLALAIGTYRFFYRNVRYYRMGIRSRGAHASR